MNETPHIDDAIAAHEAEVLRLRHELEIAEAELRGMKLVRDKFLQTATQRSPLVPTRRGQGLGESLLAYADHRKRAVDNPPTSGYRGGRQPGAISMPWRRILSRLYWEGGVIDLPSPIQAIITAAQGENIRLRPSEVEARMAHYERFGYVQRTSGGYCVLPLAAKKFGFDKEPLKDEAPNAEASGPQESLGTGDQNGAD